MTDTALKFGPEWMRALCDRGPPQANQGNSPTPASIPVAKYKLADFRYGREEMLALFDPNIKPPEELRRDNPNLMKDKCQVPLALIPMEEEESHVWNTQVNSDVVLRLTNKDRGNASGRDSGRAGGGGGPLSSVDRGLPDLRGNRLASSSTGSSLRGPGLSSRPLPPSSSSRFPFGRSLEDDGDPVNDRKEGFRGEFKRGISLSEDPPGPPRGFRERDGNEGKPRTRLDSRSNTDNWRKKTTDPPAAPMTETRERSWRGGSSRDDNWSGKPGGGSSWRDNEKGDDDDYRNGSRGSRYRNLDWDRHNHDEGNLPEWSLDDADVGTGVGTFDASGAFRSGSPEQEVEEDDGEGEWHSVGRRAKRNSERDSQSSAQRDDKDRHHHQHHSDRNDRDFKNDNRSHEGKMFPGDRGKGRTGSPDRNEENRQKQTDSLFHSSQNKTASSDDRSRGLLDQLRQNQQSKDESPKNSQVNQASASSSQVTRNDFEEDTFGISIEKLTEHMVMKWTEEDEAKLEADLAREKETEIKVAQHQQQQMSSNDSSSSTKWFYRDPQGEVQGPFGSQEMLEWFNAGYFTRDLFVRRSCDDRFSQLGSLLKEWNRNPFTPGSEPPPLRQHDPQGKSLHPQQQPQQHVIPQAIPGLHSSSPTPSDLHLRQQQQHQSLMIMQQLQRQKQQEQMLQLQRQHQQTQMQAQLRSLLEHLRSQKGFNELSQQEQQQILLKQYAQIIEQRKRQQLAQQQQEGRERSIWELTNGGVMTSAALEEMQRREEQERNQMEDMRKRLHEEEQRRRLEAERREEEERQKQELQRRKQLEEEALKMREEQLRKQQEEHEMRLKLQREEEERQQQRLRDEEVRKREEARRRHEEMRRLEEMARKQKEEAERREAEEQQMRQQRQEMERQRLQQQEHEARMRQQQQQQQQEAMRKAKGWGEVSQGTSPNLSLAQMMQEEKERDERMKQEALRKQQMQSLFSHQQSSSSSSSRMTWGQSSSPSGIKTLAEIQREEAEKLALQKKQQEEKERERGQPAGNTGIWSNAASQLSWKGSSGGPAWGSTGSPSNTSSKNQQTSSSMSSTLTGVGFWESDHLSISSNTSSSNQNNSSNRSGNQSKSSSNESAFNSKQQSSSNTSSKSSAKNKKEEVG